MRSTLSYLAPSIAAALLLAAPSAWADSITIDFDLTSSSISLLGGILDIPPDGSLTSATAQLTVPASSLTSALAGSAQLSALDLAATINGTIGGSILITGGFTASQIGGGGEIDLVDQHHVGAGDLVGIERPQRGAQAREARRIDDANRCRERYLGGGDGGNQIGGHGDAARLDDHPLGRQPLVDLLQGVDERAAQAAADAARGELDGLHRGAFEDGAVDTDVAEFIDHHHQRPAGGRRGENAPQQGGLAGAEKAEDQGRFHPAFAARRASRCWARQAAM